MYRFLLSLAIGWAGFAQLHAQLIPSDRAIAWQPGVTVGVRGGIADRQEIFKSFSPGATADQINQAIVQCPAGKVIELAAGDYHLTKRLFFPTGKDGITLRGAGMGKTVLHMDIGTSASIASEQTSITYGVKGTIKSGFTKGSDQIVVSDLVNPSNQIRFGVGDMLVLFEANDPDFVWSRWGHPDLIRQPVVITEMRGDTVKFYPPMVTDFKSALNPRFGSFYPTPPTGIGLEDFTINKVSSGEWATIWFSGYNNWFKNLEIRNCGEHAIVLTQSANCEMRGCLINGTNTPNEGYGITAYHETSGLLIEDNIFTNLWTGPVLDNSMGSVVSYNFSHNTFVPPLGAWPHQTPGIVIQHLPHGMMCLYEGNVAGQIQNDGYHGSGSHHTLFRNRFHGLHPSYETNRKMIDLCRYSYYHNVIGNVLGDTTWQADAYEMEGNTWHYEHSVMYRLGFPNSGNNYFHPNNPPSNGDAGGFDPKVEQTLIRHGNYDYFNHAAQWDAAIGNTTLPASLVHTNKPDFFGNCPWPPIGPDVLSKATPIPAQMRYEQIAPCALSSLAPEQSQLAESFSVLPNPASTTLQVAYGGNEKLISICMYSPSGKQVFSSSEAQVFDISNLPNGMYFIQVNTQSGSSIKSLAVLHE